MEDRTAAVFPQQLIRPDVGTLKYSPVQSLESIAQEVGLRVEDLIKMDANENAYGTPDEVKQAIADAFSKLHIYPDPDQALLKEALVRTLHPGFTPQQIVCGAGSDDILDMITRLLSPKVILTSTPTFGMYSFLAKVAAARVIDVPRKPQTFDLDIDAMVSSIREHEVPLVFVPSPNNPTGNVMDEDQVRKLCQEKCVVVIDEAYIEFSDLPSFADGPLPSEFPNLVVCRTFSKWAGLAGVRVGYAVSTSAKLVEGMMALKQPYNISIPADAAARAALAHREKIMKTVRLLVEEKERLFALLSSPVFKPYLRPVPSKANFVLCEILPSAAATAVEVAKGLRQRGILIRYFGSQGGALQNYIRISSSLPWHTDRAVADAMGDYKPEGILFDMDGVLADVSASYRQAIILTAKFYGVEVTGEVVARAKAAGDANNDWKLTRRLIANAKSGADEVPSLEEVTAKFEEYYQGTPERAGLWTTEKLIIDKNLLEKLSAKHPLGVVTGRPRSDARKFLDHYGIGTYFKAVVCMEDTPKPKPDPAPVALALQQLGVSSAVLIGDTVDDIRAATSAGIKGLGVVAPGGESKVEAEWALLLSAGASLVLDNSLDELEKPAAPKRKRVIAIPAPPPDEAEGKSRRRRNKKPPAAKLPKIKQEPEQAESAAPPTPPPPATRIARSRRAATSAQAKRKWREEEEEEAEAEEWVNVQWEQRTHQPDDDDDDDDNEQARKHKKQKHATSPQAAAPPHAGQAPSEAEASDEEEDTPTPSSPSEATLFEFKKRWDDLMAPPKPPSPGKDDLEQVLARTERIELFADDEWNRNKDTQAFLSLQAQKDKLSNLKAEVDKGAAMVLSLWGTKGAGKSWTGNTLIDQLLNCKFPAEEAGVTPLPSFSGWKDGSPWPIFIRLLPSVTQMRAYRETCSKQEYLTRVKSQTVTLTTQDETVLKEYGCTEREAEVMLDPVNPIGAELSPKFAKQVPLCDLPQGLSTVDALRRIKGALIKLRDAKPHDDLLTNWCVIEIKHDLGIELRDIPGTGHGDWRWHRDVHASRHLLATSGSRLITPDELDNLHTCQLYAEQNFVYNQPPKLVILPNMTHNRTRVVLPDQPLNGDSNVPFVELICQQVHDSLQPNKRLSGSTVMWEGIDEDLRSDMLAKARESLEVIPFYPRPVKLSTGQDYDSIRLLCAVVEQQKAQKLANMCSVGMRLARTWLFHAWSAVAKAKKRSKGQTAPKCNDEFIKQLDGLFKSFNQQYIRGLATKIQPDDDTVDVICNRVAPLLEKSLQQLQLEQPPSTLTDKELRAKLTTIQEQALKEIMKEVDLWIKRKLKEIKPLRRVLVDDLRRPFTQLPNAAGAGDAEEGLTGAHFPLSQLQGQEEEVFKEVQEWLAGSKMFAELEKMTRRAYSKAMTLYIKKRRGEALESVREELEWVLRQAVQYTMCGDPTIKKQHSVLNILREVITNPRTNTLKPSYFRGIKGLIEAVTVTPEQFADMSKKKEQKLKDLNRLLVNYGAAAPKGARPPSYYNPVHVRKIIDALRQAPRKPALAKNKEKQWAQCQLRSMQHVLVPVAESDDDLLPKVKVQELMEHPRHITASRSAKGVYTFWIPSSLRQDYTKFMRADEEADGRLPCPVVATMFDKAGMAQLWPCIQRLDQFEPNYGGKYFLFVIVDDADWDAAQHIFESCPPTYLIRMPKPRGNVKVDAHEPLEVAKQFGEALGPEFDFDVHYVLSESVEFIREYDEKQCQMVPSTYYRAFQEGLRVYKHMEDVYQKELLQYLKPELGKIGHLCHDTSAIMEQQSKLLTNPTKFVVQDLLDLLPPQDSFTKKINKLQAKLEKLESKLQSDKERGKLRGKIRKVEDKIKKLEDKNKQLSDFQNNIQARRGAYRIGPIFFANVTNGDNKCNHACSGTYFPTKTSVTNLVLFNTKSMQPYRVVSVKKRRGPLPKKPLVPLARQMWQDGRPPVVVFNFEYYPKAPKIAVQHLDQVKPDVVQAQEELEARQFLQRVDETADDYDEHATEKEDSDVEE